MANPHRAVKATTKPERQLWQSWRKAHGAVSGSEKWLNNSKPNGADLLFTTSNHQFVVTINAKMTYADVTVFYNGDLKANGGWSNPDKILGMLVTRDIDVETAEAAQDEQMAVSELPKCGTWHDWLPFDVW